MTNTKAFAFGDKRIGSGEPVFVIAEIGINHEGDFDACARLTEAAAKVGADAIKLQTVDPDENYAPGTESHALFSRAVLSPDETGRIFALSRRLGVEPFTTVGDASTLEWVERLEPSGYKISSGLLTATPMIHFAARTGRPMILSTGMAEESDIARGLEVAREAGATDLAILQCTSMYPAPDDILNLAAIRPMAAKFDVPVGFSDHSIGIEAAGLAVAAGAVIIEKHISLDVTRPEFDHRLSLEPEDFRRMVDGVRRAERMMGSSEKRPHAAEREAATRLHRRLAARRDLGAGEALSAENIVLLRFPEGTDGMAPDAYWSVLGRKVIDPMARHAPITETNLQGD